MSSTGTATRFVLCVSNGEYPASLEMRKVYEVLPDAEAERLGFLRVVDESGEDYLYPQTLFGEVQISEAVSDALRRVS